MEFLWKKQARKILSYFVSIEYFIKSMEKKKV